MLSLSVVVCFGLLAFANAAVEFEQCPDHNFPDLNKNVHLTPCKRVPCRLKKGTDQHISIKFTPEKDIDDLKNHVSANVFGVDLPFVGVDGNSVCSKVFTEDGNEASCPLKAGTTYTYKDSFPILAFYPSVSVKIHWALQNNKKDLVCFQLPATIV